ncbi:heavy-metal-associated domain-containing protein [Caldimonas thermodepolymerans]|jgi:copper ion binding protein|uniref:heavy-metal-associated domain-containing protein n=1 Tax=Caldimonas thermodepolymerans TaxID=215580 RepID=UPI0024907B77|nr:copper ion binding protein [Caldimonas thermodepolymerans]
MNQTFEVQGMSCQHCVRAVTQAVQRLDPQARIAVSLEQGKVEVDSTQPREAIARAIADEGYQVSA